MLSILQGQYGHLSLTSHSKGKYQQHKDISSEFGPPLSESIGILLKNGHGLAPLKA